MKDPVAAWRETLPAVTVLEGDCRDRLRELPDESVDLALADVPYGQDYQSHRPNTPRPKISGDASREAALHLLYDIKNELWRVLKADAHLYLFCRPALVADFREAVEYPFEWGGEIIWAKGRGTGDTTGRKYVPAHERVLYFRKGDRRLTGHPSDLIWVGRTTRDLHVAQKDLMGLAELIGNSTAPHEVVLDFTAGSGSTGAACLEGFAEGEERTAILMDQDPDSVAAMHKRLVGYGMARELPPYKHNLLTTRVYAARLSDMDILIRCEQFRLVRDMEAAGIDAHEIYRRGGRAYLQRHNDAAVLDPLLKRWDDLREAERVRDSRKNEAGTRYQKHAAAEDVFGQREAARLEAFADDDGTDDGHGGEQR